MKKRSRMNRKQEPYAGNGLMRNSTRLQLGIVICFASSLLPATFAVAEETTTIATLSKADADKLGGKSIFGEQERLPTVAGGRLALPTIAALTIDTEKIGNGSTPKEFRSEAETPQTDLPESGYDRDQQWASSQYQFAAANTFSHPRYFEDRMLERHGYERFPYLQPFVSGARFFSTIPMLPYLMTIQNPCECESQLGYFRPGSCVAPYVQRPPYQRDAVLVEGAAIAGAIIAIP